MNHAPTPVTPNSTKLSKDILMPCAKRMQKCRSGEFCDGFLTALVLSTRHY